MENKNGLYKKVGDYHFYMKPDKSMFALAMPDGRRIMCTANPYIDQRFTSWLDELDNGKVSKVLHPLMKKYKMPGTVPVLMDCTNSGFKFVKGEVQNEIDAISAQIQKLIGIYCSKNKKKNYEEDCEEVSEIQDYFRGVI